MRKKLPVLLLALIILLQAFTPAVFATSKNEAQSQTAYCCPLDATSEGAGKVYNAGGDAALRATRRPAFDNMLKNGVEVNGNSFKLNEHAYNSMFKSGRKDVMPDDIIDALATKSQPAQPGSVQYINPSTGTTVFVNPTSNEIVGIWPSGFGK